MILFVPGSLAQAQPPHPPPYANFTGHWDTNWGPLIMSQSGDHVNGDYSYQKKQGMMRGTVKGRVQGPTFFGTWKQPGGWGQVEFTMAPDGRSFRGRWRNGDRGAWDSWTGVRR